MSERKLCLSAGGACIALSVLILASLSFLDLQPQITKYSLKFSTPGYPENRDLMDNDMAQILLPRLKEQRANEEKMGRVKKPDMVFVPQQLQSERGY